MPNSSPLPPVGRPTPPCPRSGHAGSLVARFGAYVAADGLRQRYRCIPHHGASPHYFSGTAHDSVAEIPAWSHRYPVEQVARALLAVGRGASYRQASIHAAGPAGSGGPVRPDGQRVARWVDRFGPVVAGCGASAPVPVGPGVLSFGVLPPTPECAALLLAAWHAPDTDHVAVHALEETRDPGPSRWSALLDRLDLTPATLVLVDTSATDLLAPLRARGSRVLDAGPADPRGTDLDVEAHGSLGPDVLPRTAALLGRLGAVSTRLRLTRDATRRGLVLDLARQGLNGSASVESYCAALTARAHTVPTA